MNYDYLCMGCMTNKGIADKCPYCGYDEESSEIHPSHLRLRTVLNDRYIIGKALGHGGFGITYIAWDTKFEIPIAIKEYLPSSLASRSSGHSEVTVHSEKEGSQFSHYLDKFLDEAKTLAQFNNEAGIVSVQDFFKANGTVYIIMFYVNGLTLENYLKENGNKLSYDKTIKIMSSVMKSLAKVHKKGLIHRDISPDNIYITKDNQVKLLDFGAARYVVGDDNKSLSVILKRGYAPVEQYYSKGKQGPWTDVYAVAATIYRMLTGEKPPESTERVMEDEIKAPSELGIDIPVYVEKALMKAIATRHTERFQNMEQFLNALNFSDDIAPVAETQLLTEETEEQEGTEVLIEENEKKEEIGVLDECESKVHNPSNGMKEGKKKKNKKAIILGILGIVVIFAAVTIFASIGLDNSRKKDSKVGTEITENSNDDIVKDEKIKTLEQENKYIATDKDDEAERVLKEAMDIDKTEPEIYVKSVDVYEETNKDKEESTDLLEDATKNSEDDRVTDKLEEINIEPPQASVLSGHEEEEFLQVINFPDKKLEAVIRTVINKPTGNIYTSDVENITVLDNPLFTEADTGGLTEEQVNSRTIKNLEGIQYLTNLEYLNLSCHEVNDINYLKELRNLECLYLDNNLIKDISSLKGLTKLNTLDLSHNQIKNISAVKGLINLTFLNLMGNEIKDIDTSAIKDLRNLTNLDFSYNQINHIEESTFKGLKNLKVLYLSHNQIEDIAISSLKGVTKLTLLHLYGNQIREISALKGLTNLKTLYSGNNQIKDISVLKELTNLTEVYLDDNQIKDISPLNELRNLTELGLSNNKITKISALEELTNVTHLYLKGNQITDYIPVKDYYYNLQEKDFELNLD